MPFRQQKTADAKTQSKHNPRASADCETANRTCRGSEIRVWPEYRRHNKASDEQTEAAREESTQERGFYECLNGVHIRTAERLKSPMSGTRETASRTLMHVPLI